jgi:hypothetical protein
MGASPWPGPWAPIPTRSPPAVAGSSSAGSVDFGARSHRQSLARDLSLSSDYELLQQFVPELKMLRLPGTDRHTAATATTSAAAMAPHSGKGGSLRTEIVASFSWSGANPTAPFGVSILNGTAKLTVDCEGADPQAVGGCMVCAAGHPSTAPHTHHITPPTRYDAGRSSRSGDQDRPPPLTRSPTTKSSRPSGTTGPPW